MPLVVKKMAFRSGVVLFIGRASTNPFDERIVLSEFNCSSRYAGLIQLG